MPQRGDGSRITLRITSRHLNISIIIFRINDLTNQINEKNQFIGAMNEEIAELKRLNIDSRNDDEIKFVANLFMPSKN